MRKLALSFLNLKQAHTAGTNVPSPFGKTKVID